MLLTVRREQEIVSKLIECNKSNEQQPCHPNLTNENSMEVDGSKQIKIDGRLPDIYLRFSLVVSFFLYIHLVFFSRQIKP